MRISNQKLIPKLHILNLVTTDKHGDAHLFLYTAIANSQEEAFDQAMDNMKDTVPRLYIIGKENNGFDIASHKELSYTELQRSFKTKIEGAAIHQRPKLELVPYVTEETSKKDKLIKKIISKNSTKYLDKHAHKLNDFEVAYIRDQINTKK